MSLLTQLLLVVLKSFGIEIERLSAASDDDRTYISLLTPYSCLILCTFQNLYSLKIHKKLKILPHFRFNLKINIYPIKSNLKLINPSTTSLVSFKPLSRAVRTRDLVKKHQPFILCRKHGYKSIWGQRTSRSRDLSTPKTK